MLLVTLVVVRHSWMLLPGDGPDGRIGEFLYTWHMPAFVLVTGYLSRGFSYTPARIWQLVRTVAAPYLIFECAMVLFRMYAGGEHFSDVVHDPVWPLWFLSSLFFWRLSVPLFRRMPGLAVPVAVAISVAAGLTDWTFLDLARMLGMLPFFVVGLMATPERLEWLRGTAPKVAAVVLLAGIWLASGHLDGWAGTGDWLYYKASYGEMGAAVGPALLIRMVVIGVGVAGSMAFLALVPRRGGWFARMGRWTLVVYLFHGFVVKAVEFGPFPGWAEAHPVLGFAIASTGGVLLALALASPPLARRLEHLADPLGSAQRRVEQTVDLAVDSGMAGRR